MNTAHMPKRRRKQIHKQFIVQWQNQQNQPIKPALWVVPVAFVLMGLFYVAMALTITYAMTKPVEW